MNKIDLGSQEVSPAKRTHSPRSPLVLLALMALCTLIYYFGEMVDFAGLEALRWKFFYSVHDTHRLFFLAPIIYAGYVYRVKGAVIITLVSFVVFMPRAFFISPFPDPLLRMTLFTIIAGVMGYLTGAVRNESERRSSLEAQLKDQRDKLLKLLDGVGERIIIVGPDYKIRFVNLSMRRDFGEGEGALCYKYLFKLDSPCPKNCKLPSVIAGGVEKGQYDLPDGKTYESLGSPYVDSDGVVCQLAMFRAITQREKV